MHAALPALLLAALPAQPRLAVSGESALALFPSYPGETLGGWATITRLRVGLQLPAFGLLATPDLGVGFSLPLPSTGFLEASGGVRLALDLEPTPFLFVRAGYGSWAAFVPDRGSAEATGPTIGPALRTVASQEGILGGAGAGIELPLKHGVFLGAQLSYERFLDVVQSTTSRPIDWFSAGVVARFLPE